jgi:hypothetical protein
VATRKPTKPHSAADGTGVTSPHKNAQWEPSPQQTAAIEALALGKRDADAGEAAGVSRETVNRWRNHNPCFKAALNKRQQELWSDGHNRLRGLVGKAVEKLESALDDPATALPAAVHVLKATKIFGEVAPPSGATDPELILQLEAETWAREEMKRRKEWKVPPAVFLSHLDDETVFNQKRLDELTEERLAILKEAHGM